MRAEAAALRDLLEQAGRVREHAPDSKLAALKACLTRAQFAELKDGRGKLLIFTEHRDTLTYLRGHLAAWGYSTCEIHGGMNPRERRDAQDAFRTADDVLRVASDVFEPSRMTLSLVVPEKDPASEKQWLGTLQALG